MSLFKEWLAIEKQKGTQQEAIERLNTHCGTKYRKNLPAQMKAGDYSLERIPTSVRRYMMEAVLKQELPEKNEEELNDLLYKLT